MAEELNEEIWKEDAQKGKFMTFQTGKEYFGIGISYVNEIIAMQPITAIPEAADYIRGLINLRGKIIPVIDIRIRFKMEPIEYTDRTCIIVINVRSTVIGLIVEKISEVCTITDDEIVPPPKLESKASAKNSYVYGLARTGDTVKLLIDPDKLIKDEDLETLEENQEVIEEEV